MTHGGIPTREGARLAVARGAHHTRAATEQVNDSLIRCVGVDPRDLDGSPVERTRYLVMGTSVALTATFSAVTLPVALSLAIGSFSLLYLIAGLLWAVFVFNLDRWVVSTVDYGSLRLDGSSTLSERISRIIRRMALLGVRLLISALIGLAISEPLLFLIFQKEIAVQIASDRTDEVNRASGEVESDQAYIARLAPFQGLLDEATQARENAEQAVADANNLLDAEQGGFGGTRRPGEGDRAGERRTDLRSSQIALTDAQTDERVAQAAYNTTKAQVDADKAIARNERIALIQQNPGLLDREKALARIAADPAVARTQWLVRGLILLLDVAPLLLKLFSPTTGHERLVRAGVVRRVAAIEEAIRPGVESAGHIAKAERERDVSLGLQRIRYDYRLQSEKIRRDTDRQLRELISLHATSDVVATFPTIDDPGVLDLERYGLVPTRLTEFVEQKNTAKTGPGFPWWPRTRPSQSPKQPGPAPTDEPPDDPEGGGLWVGYRNDPEDVPPDAGPPPRRPSRQIPNSDAADLAALNRMAYGAVDDTDHTADDGTATDERIDRLVDGRWRIGSPIDNADSSPSRRTPYKAVDIFKVYPYVAALKIIHPPDKDHGTFEARREVTSLPYDVEISPHVTRVIHGGYDPHFGWFVVTPYYRAGTLARKAATEVVTLRTALRVLGQTLVGLRDAFVYNDRLLAHFDIKPSNLALDDDGRIRIIDWGLAEALSPRHQGGNELRSGYSAWYAPPEQVLASSAGSANWKSPLADIRAVAAVFYFLVTGYPPLYLEAHSAGLIDDEGEIRSSRIEDFRALLRHTSPTPLSQFFDASGIAGPPSLTELSDLVAQWLDPRANRRVRAVSEGTAHDAALAALEPLITDIGRHRSGLIDMDVGHKHMNIPQLRPVRVSEADTNVRAARNIETKSNNPES